MPLQRESECCIVVMISGSDLMFRCCQDLGLHQCQEELKVSQHKLFKFSLPLLLLALETQPIWFCVSVYCLSSWLLLCHDCCYCFASAFPQPSNHHRKQTQTSIESAQWVVTSTQHKCPGSPRTRKQPNSCPIAPPAWANTQHAPAADQTRPAHRHPPQRGPVKGDS